MYRVQQAAKRSKGPAMAISADGGGGKDGDDDDLFPRSRRGVYIDRRMSVPRQRGGRRAARIIGPGRRAAHDSVARAAARTYAVVIATR